MMKHLSLCCLLLLAACAQPVTVKPTATPQEIALEAAAQEKFVMDEKAKGLVHGLYESKPMAPRLQAVASRIAPASVELCRALKLVPDPRSCAYGIRVKRSRNGEGTDTLNAYADGEQIYITSAMVRFADDDDQLAFIIAHEFAHNLMGHIDAKKQNLLVGMLIGAAADAVLASQGYNSGSASFMKAGAESGALVYSPEFEQEADYIGLYLMARAGYDFEDAPYFWRRMSVENQEAIYFTTTHPSNAERFVLMKKYIAEIKAKKAAGRPLFPEFQQAEQKK